MAKTKTKKKSTRAASRSTGARETSAEHKARQQMTAVILFAVAILLFCFAAIRGENLWTWIHDVMRGLFSISAFVMPLVLAVVAVLMAFEKENVRIRARVMEASAFIVMLNSVIYAFTTRADDFKYFWFIGKGSGETELTSTFVQAYERGRSLRGGGALGALLGWPVEKLFGDTGAKIILILLVVVFFMLITGTTIVAVIKMLRKPVDKAKEGFEQVVAQSAERAAARENDKEIDIDLGDGYPRNSRRRTKAAPVEEPEEEEPVVPLTPVKPIVPASEKLEAFRKAAAAMSEKPEDAAPAKETEKETAAPTEKEEKAEKEDDGDEGAYRYPPLSLLNEIKPPETADSEAELRANGQLLVNTLKDFGISTRLSDVTCGSSVTRYELEPSAGVKISRITGLADDIALRLATTGVRIEAPIPNKAAVGIEVPNKVRRTVGLRRLLDSNEFRSAKGKLTVALGQDIEGNAVLTDLAKMPHLLIAGTTGSGKSVCTNSMIQSVLFRATPDEVKMILIDPKKVEFGVYNGIPHLLVPVVTDPRKAAGALSWAVNEMLKRYQMFAEANVRDITGYNEQARIDDSHKPLPLILIVIDELADLMMAAANEVEDSICRLAQMARAAGMHMVIATQRPSVDVITGLIKANIPSRLALTVASAVDSRTILDAGGAEKLLGYGDMLFMPVGQSKPSRVQGCFVANEEIERVIDFLKATDEWECDQAIIDEIDKQAAAAGRASARGGDASGDDEDDVDEALSQAIEIAVNEGQISTSMLQRKMRFGYARAGRIIDQMEQRGIIGPSEGSKPRKVLITRQQWIERDMNTSDDEA